MSQADKFTEDEVKNILASSQDARVTNTVTHHFTTAMRELFKHERSAV